jgi:hypothetical protein
VGSEMCIRDRSRTAIGSKKNNACQSGFES